MTEPEEDTYSVELVPDTILHIVEQNGLLNDVNSVLSLRRLSKTWNATLRHLVGTRMVTVLSEKNLSAFSQFLTSEASIELQESNIRSLTLNLHSQQDCKKALDEFAKLPAFFRSQLLCFKLYLNLDALRLSEQLEPFLKEAQLISLEELEFVVGREDCKISEQIVLLQSVSLENIRFQFLRRLTVPLHMSVQFLKTCSVLTHLSLDVFNMDFSPDFWNCFKTEVCLRGLNESIVELFFVNRRDLDSYEMKTIYSFVTLFECNFKLRKLGLSVTLLDVSEEDILALFRFLTQQSATLEYLQLPQYYTGGSTDGSDKVAFLSDTSNFSKLVEVKLEGFNTEYYQLLVQSPRLEKICFPEWNYVITSSILLLREVSAWRMLPIRSLRIRNHDFFSESSFQQFPNLHSLEVDKNFSPPHLSTEILIPGTNLKKLSIKVEANIIHERALKRHDENYQPSDNYFYCSVEAHEDRERRHERPIKADCFLLGQKPRHCKPYQHGEIPCNEKTEFRIPSAPSICNFHNLEYLCLEGYFTELTIWAGIKGLTQLQEFHLKTQYLMYPSTLIQLEAHLPQLRTWSYTKLEEMYDLGNFPMREMFKCYRKLPTILPKDHLYVWKFNDDDVEKKLVSLMEYDRLNLNYTGTAFVISDGFWPEPESESESGSEFSDSD